MQMMPLRVSALPREQGGHSVVRGEPEFICDSPALAGRAIAFAGIPVFLSVVIPAKAGIQGFKTRHLPWIPAFAGMTVEEGAAMVKCNSPAPSRERHTRGRETHSDPESDRVRRGRQALVHAAAHAEHPELARPTDLPETNESDRACAAAASNYLESTICILECHVFLPSDESFLIAVPDAVGVDRVATSTANLAWALESINRAHWKADAPQIASWARRGPTSRRAMAVQDGKLVDDVAPPPSPNPFEHAAQFAFALYGDALNFSRTHRLPILTDE